MERTKSLEMEKAQRKLPFLVVALLGCTACMSDKKLNKFALQIGERRELRLSSLYGPFDSSQAINFKAVPFQPPPPHTCNIMASIIWMLELLEVWHSSA